MKQFKPLAAIAVLSICALVVPAGMSFAQSPNSTVLGNNKPGQKIDLGGQSVVALFTSFNNDYYAAWDQGAKRAVLAFGGKYVPLTNEGDPAKQIAQFQQQVDAGAKVIFVTAPDPANVPAMAKIATEKGVCLANTWEQPPWTSPFDSGDGYTTYLSSDSVGEGYSVAKALFIKMGSKGNFVHLTGHIGSTPSEQRTIGVDQALKEFPKIKMIARLPGEWNRDTARKVMAGIIAKYGKKINGVFGQNDDVGIGAYNALKEAGIKGVPITGIDGNLGTMSLIKSGAIYGAYTTFPQWSAGFSMVQALDSCLGVQADPLNRQLLSKGLFVTAANVDMYLKKYLGAKDPYDWQLMSRFVHPNDWDPQNDVQVLQMSKFWAFAPKPADYAAPAAYTSALSNLAKINAEWVSHWKKVK